MFTNRKSYFVNRTSYPYLFYRMLHPVFYYIFAQLLIGAVGMGIANRKADTLTKRQRWLKFFTYILIVGFVLSAILLHWFWCVAPLIVVIGGVELLRAILHSQQRVALPIALLIVTGYVFVSGSFVVFAWVSAQSFLLFIYFQVITFDGFSQVCGQLAGKQALLPAVSPNKTVEGLAGGMLFTLLATALARHWIAASLLQVLLLALGTGGSALAGDLLASYLKRLTYIKDYSNLLPGHGGVLDRFDSLLMTGAFYYWVHAVFG